MSVLCAGARGTVLHRELRANQLALRSLRSRRQHRRSREVREVREEDAHLDREARSPA